MSDRTMTRTPASPRLKARIAGFLYLLIMVGAMLIPFHVGPSGIIGMTLGEAALQTLARIEAAKELYVLSGAGQLMVLACDIGVAAILYDLLKPAGKTLALAAIFFRLAFVTVAGANLFNHFAVLLFLSGADYLGALGADQTHALAAAFLKLRTLGFDVSLVFFGIHLSLVGILILRSTFLPRVLGLALAIGGGAGYLSNMLVHAMAPAVRDMFFPYVMFLALPEIVFALWLLIVGVNAAKWNAQAGVAQAR
jgi:hypothetical protein